jgi:hypothetical protein
MSNTFKKTHECNELNNSNNPLVEIEIFDKSGWVIYEGMDDAVIRGIKYCPFCGVELTY